MPQRLQKYIIINNIMECSLQKGKKNNLVDKDNNIDYSVNSSIR